MNDLIEKKIKMRGVIENLYPDLPEDQVTEFLNRYMSGIIDLDGKAMNPSINEGIAADVETRRRFQLGRANGGRIGFESGTEGTVGSDITSRKRANYFDLKRDEFMSLADYLKSGMSEKDLEIGMIIQADTDLIQVLWPSFGTGWISKDDLEKINESR